MASSDEPERLQFSTPGSWPSASANSFRQQYLAPEGSETISQTSSTQPSPEETLATFTMATFTTNNHTITSPNSHNLQSPTNGSDLVSSDEETAVPSPADLQHHVSQAQAPNLDSISTDEEIETEERAHAIGGFAPIKSTTSNKTAKRSDMHGKMTENELFQSLSRRRPTQVGGRGLS